MKKLGVISKINKPTEWCTGMVVVPKNNGKVRICVDLTRLNDSVCRERHPLPAVDQTLAKLSEAKLFSKLDANSGFWQILLSPESIPFTMFKTPLADFVFTDCRSAPKHFQRRMSELLGDIEVVVCLINDVLVYRKTPEEDDNSLNQVLKI